MEKISINQTSDLKIFIDVGHGMANRHPRLYDPGALCTMSAFKYQEANIAMAFAMDLARHCQNLQVEYCLSRSNAQQRSPLNQRVVLALRNNCNHLISFHLNSSVIPSARGLEIWYRRDQDRQRAQVLALELSEILHIPNRGAKASSHLAVLKFPGPAFLIELGFITHPEDLKALVDRDLQDRICEHLAHVFWIRPSEF